MKALLLWKEESWSFNSESMGTDLKIEAHNGSAVDYSAVPWRRITTATAVRIIAQLLRNTEINLPAACPVSPTEQSLPVMQSSFRPASH